VEDRRVFLARRTHRHDVAGLQRVGRDVDLLAVDEEVAVAHELTSLRARGGEAHAVDRVVEAPFEQLEQRLAGDAAGAVGHFEVAAELIFEHAVGALDLLLLAQLHAVADHLRGARRPCWPGGMLRFSMAHFSV
jgi:hypothetical protein